jgi:hypothetical protein
MKKSPKTRIKMLRVVLILSKSPVYLTKRSIE